MSIPMQDGFVPNGDFKLVNTQHVGHGGGNTALSSVINDVEKTKDDAVRLGRIDGLLFFDAFNRSNSNTLGDPWVNVDGTFSIVDGKAKAATLTGANARNYVDVGVSDFEVSVDITWNAYAGLQFRYYDTNNYLLARINDTGLALSKYISAVNTPISTYEFTPEVGTTYNLKIVANNANIKVYLDQRLVIEVNESASVAQKKIGLRVASSDTTSTFDNFSIRSIGEEGEINRLKAVYERKIANLVDKGITKLNFFATPTQPDTWVNTTMDGDTFLATFYDPLIGVKEDGYKVVKKNIGKDESGTYNIYRYTFEPRNYTRTIYFESLMHGIELPDAFAWALLMKAVVQNPDDNPLYRYLRDNVRIMGIPLFNPWGFNQSPRTYGNVNGVNLNRNFATQAVWDELTEPVGDIYKLKGSAPFSEAESRLLRDELLLFKDDIDLFVNLHVGVGGDIDLWCYYVNEDTDTYLGLKKAVEWLTNKLETDLSRDVAVRFEDLDSNVLIRHIYHNYGIHATTWEFSPELVGGAGTFNGTDDLTYNYLHIANYLIGALIGTSTSYERKVYDLETNYGQRLYALEGVLVYDDFNRDNSETLGQAKTGQLWEDEQGSFGIVNNRAITKTNDGGNAKCAIETEHTDFVITANLRWQAFAGILFRYVDPNNYLMVRINETSLTISSFVSGSSTQLDEHTFTPSHGRYYNLKIIANGGDISVYLDGTEVATASEVTAHSTATKVGLRTFSDPVSTFEDFKVEKLPPSEP
jgi:hypothetical protein